MKFFIGYTIFFNKFKGYNYKAMDNMIFMYKKRSKKCIKYTKKFEILLNTARFQKYYK